MVGLTLLGSALLALMDSKRVPNEEAIALSPSIGWAMLVAAVGVFALFILQSDRWRRWWLTAEDPRAMAMFRILFAFWTICNVNDLWEYFHFLFTDEGIFPADVARQVHASAQFKGFGDGFGPDDPWGFFDFDAVLLFLQGPKFSLLYFWDTPTAFWIHLGAFELCGLLFMIGFFTRTMGILTFFLMNSIFFRNHLFWEGTELIYRVTLAYLICAKSGRAYSIDNWLRCRKLRKKGLLSDRGGPGNGAGVAPSDEHPRGLEAVYRLIPAWPRRLLMAQAAVVYAFTGIVKNGSVWARGDAIYYAWNMDHFYRFYPQRISAVIGTNLLRLVTWTVHWGEVFTFLALIGAVTLWGVREKLPRLTGARLWSVRGAWAVIGGASGAIVFIAWPVHYSPFPREFFVPAWIAACALLGWFWWRLGNKPFKVSSIFRVRKLKQTYVLDRVWFATWFLGRRIWITFAIGMQLGIFFLMNIGMFQTGTATMFTSYFRGEEVGRVLNRLGRRLAKWGVPFMPESCKRGQDELPGEDPSLPHLKRDAARIPEWTMVAALLIVVVGIVVRAVWNPPWGWVRIWIGALLFLMAIGVQRWRANRRRQLSVLDPDKNAPRTPWGYGPLGRFLIGGLLVWQITGVATWLMPDKDSLRSFRGPARRVWAKWLTFTQTDQSWGMFAPNPPRSNVFLKVLVHDQDGEVWDMRTDVYAAERKPIPWIWNDRMRKMNRRIIGGESGNTGWYRKWYARYHCRQWAMDHGGDPPDKVELIKVWYRMPSPEAVRRRGWYSPEDLLARTGVEEEKYTERCKNAVMGQLPNKIRARHGLPLIEEDTYRPWLKHKKRKWMRAKEKKAKAEEQRKTGVEHKASAARLHQRKTGE